MTYTYEGHEYQVISQAGGTYVEITTAFQEVDKNHIHIIKVSDYKEFGKVYAAEITIHVQDLKSLVLAISEQEVLNNELLKPSLVAGEIFFMDR